MLRIRAEEVVAPEQRVVWAIESLRWSFEIFAGNYRELTQSLVRLEHNLDSSALRTVETREELNRVLGELGRLLFNYLAASFMLIEHTRSYLDRMYGTGEHAGFKIECQEQIDRRFAQSDVHDVAQGLRNYFQHRAFPAVGRVIQLEPETNRRGYFIIPTATLLNWDGWRGRARSKLLSMGDKFDLREFAQEHYDQVDSFQRWLQARQVELHRNDYEKLSKLRQLVKPVIPTGELMGDNDGTPIDAPINGEERSERPDIHVPLRRRHRVPEG